MGYKRTEIPSIKVQTNQESPKSKFPRSFYLDRWIPPIDLEQFHGKAAAEEFARLKAQELGNALTTLANRPEA